MRMLTRLNRLTSTWSVSFLALVLGFVLSSREATAGCGLYRFQGSDVVFSMGHDLFSQQNDAVQYVPLYLENLSGMHGRPESLCQGPECRKDTDPFKLPEFPPVSIRLVDVVPCQLRKAEPTDYADQSNRFTPLASDFRTRDGYRSELTRPPIESMN
jgi:hypothetical protein